MADYHHGNLRRAILDRALAIIAADGVEALSLRAVAVELGVSHAAPRHHFATRQALLTAIASEGFSTLADLIDEARRQEGTFLATGVAYLRFALDHPAEFEVMFTPALLDPDDPDYQAARTRALGQLRSGAAGHHQDADATALAGWSLMHGFAALAHSGSLDRAGYTGPDVDLIALAERAARLLRPDATDPADDR